MILEAAAAPTTDGADMADAEEVEPQGAERDDQGAAQPDAAVEPLFAAPEGEPDDLKKITGVGPVLEAQAPRSRRHQATTRSPASRDEDIEKVDEALNFKGRIARDDWVGQAKALAGGELIGRH